jgi:Type II intron maturase
LHHGKLIHRKALTHNTDFSIVAQYQQEYQGLVEYYRLAYNLATQFSWLKGDMQRSLVKTLACKFRISVPHIYERYRAVIDTADGPRKVLQVVVEREGKKLLVAKWGGVSLQWQKRAILNDSPSPSGTNVQNSSNGCLPNNVSCVGCEYEQMSITFGH